MNRSKAALMVAAVAGVCILPARVLAQAETAATVNGEPISRAALVERLMEQSTAGQAMLGQMICETLLAQYAAKKNITVADAEVQARIQAIRKSQSQADFNDFLLSRGLTEKGLPVFVKMNLLVERLFSDEAKVADDEVRAVYDGNKALFSQAATATVRVLETRTEAECSAARKRIMGGESFEQVARAVSTHLATRPAGGLLTADTKERLDQVFKGAGEAAFSLKVGEVSQPIKAEEGWWLVKVEESTAAATRTFDEVKERIRTTIKESRLRIAYGTWLSQALKDPANKIERKLQLEASMSAAGAK